MISEEAHELKIVFIAVKSPCHLLRLFQRGFEAKYALVEQNYPSTFSISLKGFSSAVHHAQ
jgi:hypothetical protein